MRSEKGFGIIVGLRLYVLRQGERHGPAVGRVGQHAQSLRQAFEDLLRSGDAVPPARDRPKAIINRDSRVAEPLDLLQHGIGAPARKDIAGQEQQRESIGMRDGRRRHHVSCARANRTRAGHHAAPPARLSEADRSQAHGLLVMRAQGRQPLASLVQRLTDSSDIAMPENRKNAGE